MQRFHKMHGLGNDFVVIDARDGAVEITPERARVLADRHVGIGADQVILVTPGVDADLGMRIWNADGSEVEACGNATRCVAILAGRPVSIDTAGGRLAASPIDGGASVDMGRPRFGWDEIPLAFAMDTLNMPVHWDGFDDPIAVNVGNPHIIAFVEDVDDLPLDIIGPLIEHDPLFPARVNVTGAEVAGPDHLRARTWERGAGLTRACGTAACAAAVAAIRRGIATGPVTVSLPGGDLVIDWAPGDTIRMTGPATHVFTGEIDIEALA